MTVPETALEALCRIPLEIRGWRSPSGAVKRSGYTRIRQDVTPPILAAYLTRHPEYVDQWEMYSLDKRTSAGWYCYREPAGWCVGSLTVSYPDEHYGAAADAFAEYILREVEAIHCSLNWRKPLWPKPWIPKHRDRAV